MTMHSRENESSYYYNIPNSCEPFNLKFFSEEGPRMLIFYFMLKILGNLY